MRPDKSDGPNSHCCSCLLLWNSVKDYWERLYGSVIYSITKLLIGRECYWALLAPRVSELKVVPLLSWSEDFVQCLFSSWTKVFDRLKILTGHFVDMEPFNIFTLFPRKFERLSVWFLWFCVNSIPKRTDFQPHENSSGAEWTTTGMFSRLSVRCFIRPVRCR